MNWKKLQNGSDIRGVALEGIEGENVTRLYGLENRYSRLITFRYEDFAR